MAQPALDIRGENRQARTMARVLLFTTPEKGHVNPMVGVAQWLLHDGHNVGWCCIPVPSPQVAMLGVEVVSVDGLPVPADFPTDGPALAQLVRDPVALLVWIRRLLLESVPAQIEPIRSTLGKWKPDAIALDPMLYGAIIAAHLEHIPYAGISSSLNPVTPDDFACDHQRNMRALHDERVALFARYGMSPRFRVADCLAPTLNTVFATDAYVFPFGQVPASTVLVGPSLPRAARGDEPPLPGILARTDRPLVYASFGSQIWYQPRAFQTVAEACATLGYALLVTGGELADQGFAETLPGEVEVVRYAPQLAVLDRAEVIVTHGGSNSVMEALSRSRPVLISPVCNDQPMQAAFVEAAGVGIQLDLTTASVGQASAALEALVDPRGSHRDRARQVGFSYACSDGAREAARRVTELAG